MGSMKSHSLNECTNIDDRRKKLIDIVQENEQVSNEAKSFLSELLAENGEDRPTSTQALENKWMTL